MEEKTIKRHNIYQGKIIDVVEDQVQLADGRKAKRELVFHPGAVAILPMLTANEVILVRQYRKALEQSLWEIPAGKLEANDTNHFAAAKRELSEEIGYAGELEYLGIIATSPGFANEKIHLYKATNLQKQAQPLPRDEDEELEVKVFNLAELPTIIDAKTIVALQSIGVRGVLA